MSNDNTYRVRELAELARVTVRTLHHYDAIGLLRPAARTAAGYRLYGEAELARLQQILIYRALGLPLEAIATLLNDPEHDRLAALREQRLELQQKLREAERMLRTLDRTIADLEAGTVTAPADLFDGFDPAAFAEEAEERWGESPSWEEAQRRTRRYGDAEWSALKAEAKAIYEALAEQSDQGASPSAPAVQALVVRHREHIDRWFYPCSKAHHRSLAELYESDPRFAARMNRHGEGVTTLLTAAIRSA